MAKPKDSTRNIAICKMYAVSRNADEVANHFGTSKSNVYNLWSRLPQSIKDGYKDDVNSLINETIEASVVEKLEADTEKIADFTVRLVRSRLTALERIESILDKLDKPTIKQLPMLVSTLNALNDIYKSSPSIENPNSQTNNIDDFYESVKQRSVVNNIQINHNYGKEEK